jgi:uncharacterized protein YegP (UPF0339 family)
MSANFTLRKNNEGQFYWTFQDENYEVIARSSESYISRSDCLRSIHIVRSKAATAIIWEKVGEEFNMLTDFE